MKHSTVTALSEQSEASSKTHCTCGNTPRADRARGGGGQRLLPAAHRQAVFTGGTSKGSDRGKLTVLRKAELPLVPISAVPRSETSSAEPGSPQHQGTGTTLRQELQQNEEGGAGQQEAQSEISLGSLEPALDSESPRDTEPCTTRIPHTQKDKHILNMRAPGSRTQTYKSH